MNGEPSIIHSPLERRIRENGVHIDVLIYRGVEDTGWILEVIDHKGGATVWENTFESDEDALEMVIVTIQQEGILSFSQAPFRTLH